jgi:hypothetical protein
MMNEDWASPKLGVSQIGCLYPIHKENMTIIIQYLGGSTDWRGTDPRKVRDRLQEASAIIPIDILIHGWNLPDELQDICLEESRSVGARSYLWHPLLADDGLLNPPAVCRAIGLDGQPVPAYRDLPSFSFICPNRPFMREVALPHLRKLATSRPYCGIFLDRIRYPSPAPSPDTHLACFCEDCHLIAAEQGIDLECIRRMLHKWLTKPYCHDPFEYIEHLLSRPHHSTLESLDIFLDFRERSVSRLVDDTIAVLRKDGLQVGLDCFSPMLMRMIGQNLIYLAKNADWIKIMTYGHTSAPAGIPGELNGLITWLISNTNYSETKILAKLAKFLNIPQYPSRSVLSQQGLAPSNLASETIQAKRLAPDLPIFAGLELVDLPHIAPLHTSQIVDDTTAFRAAMADGIALSWDLWHIPKKYLQLFRDTWICSTPL